MSETMVTLTGRVAGGLTRRRFEDDSAVTRFRMVGGERRDDADTEDRVDGVSMVPEVRCRDRFGDNVAARLRSGDPVIVHGRSRCREFEGVRRVARQVRATAVGRNPRFVPAPGIPLPAVA